MSRSPAYRLHRILYNLSNLPRFDAVKRWRGRHYSALMRSAGQALNVDAGVKIFNPANVAVGDNCFIGAGTRLYAWNERITIGNDVMIAADVLMITRNHGHDRLDIPMTRQGYSNAPIVIEDDVWIGFRAVILAGVTIGRGSIVGSCAVVTKDVPAYSVVGGVPARVIKSRVNGDR